MIKNSELIKAIIQSIANYDKEILSFNIVTKENEIEVTIFIRGWARSFSIPNNTESNDINTNYVIPNIEALYYEKNYS